MSVQQLEAAFVPDFLDLLVAFEKLNLTVLKEIRVTDHVPERSCVMMVDGPSVGAHPAAGLAERFVELANNEVVGGGSRGFITTNVPDIRGTEGLGALGECRSKTHPPALSTPRNGMTRGENQIAANKNAGAGP
jgi:hypothetical protein